MIILTKEMEDIVKIVKSLEKSGQLPEGARKTIENQTKDKKGGFIGVLLRTLAASLLGNVLPGKAKIPWQRVIRAVEGTIRADQDF